MGRVDDRLAELNITLPEPRAPLANYVPTVRTGNLVFTAGQISVGPGVEVRGKLGVDVSVEQGRLAARQCALNCLGALKAELGSLDRVLRIVRIAGYVNSGRGFDQQAQVMNGASDVLVEIFGDAGRHARTAIGVAELPTNVAVEVDMLAEVAGID